MSLLCCLFFGCCFVLLFAAVMHRGYIIFFKKTKVTDVGVGKFTPKQLQKMFRFHEPRIKL